MLMRRDRHRAGMALVLLFTAAATTRAAVITLNPNSTVSVKNESLTSSTPVTLLPYTTQSAVNSTATQARIVPQLTTDVLVLQFTADTAGGQADGEMDVRFHATTNATFTGYAALTTAGGVTDAELGFFVNDVTLNDQAASFLRTSSVAGTLRNNGDIQGSLIAGHDYAFDPFLFFKGTTAVTGSGSVSLAFTAVSPEPSGLALATFGAAGLLRRRRLGLASGARINQ